MALLRVALAALLLATGVVLVGPSAPAVACDCTSNRIEDHAGARDVVFRGAVVSRSRPQAGGFVYTFDVAEVFQGRTTETTQVRAASGAAICGLEGVDVGDDFLVFANVAKDPADGLLTGLCSGTQETSSNALRQIEAATGPGVPPAADPSADDTPAQPWTPYWGIAAIGGGLVALLALMLVAMRRLRA